jgi:hypothetical protein
MRSAKGAHTSSARASVTDQLERHERAFRGTTGVAASARSKGTGR